MIFLKFECIRYLRFHFRFAGSKFSVLASFVFITTYTSTFIVSENYLKRRMDTSYMIERLQCPLCTGIFIKPKCLDCGHEFCESCLRGHILRTVRAAGHCITDFNSSEGPIFQSKQKTFNCPVEDCNKEQKPLDHDKGPVDWVHDYNNDLNTQTLVEICTGQRGASYAVCHNCKNVGLQRKASHVCFNHKMLYCTTCAFVHETTYKTYQYCSTTHVADVENALVLTSGGKMEIREKEGLAKNCGPYSQPKATNVCNECSKGCCSKCLPQNHNDKGYLHASVHKSKSSSDMLKDTIAELGKDVDEIKENIRKQIDELESKNTDNPKTNSDEEQSAKATEGVEHNELEGEQKSLPKTEEANDDVHTESFARTLEMMNARCQFLERHHENILVHIGDNGTMASDCTVTELANELRRTRSEIMAIKSRLLK